MANSRLHKLKIKFRRNLPLSFKEKLILRKYFNRENFFDDYEKKNRIKYLNRKAV